MKKFLVVLFCALPQIASAGAVTHVRYNQTIVNVPSAIKSMKDACDHARKTNKMLAEIGQPPLANYKEDKLFGDASLIGQGIKDEYWSHDETYHVEYKMSYTTTNSGLPYCQLRVVPKIDITYTNYRTLIEHSYSRSYLESPNAGDKWAELEKFKKESFEKITDGKIERESWSMKKIPSETKAKELGPLLANMFTGTATKVGEDKVLNRKCKIHTVSRFGAAGMSNSSCGWDNAGGVPKIIIAKGHLNIPGGGSVTSIAESLDLNDTAPLSLLQPPEKWRNKPLDSYLKSKKTKNQWMNSKQQKAMRAARVRKEKSLSQEQKKARNRIRIETGKTPDD